MSRSEQLRQAEERARQAARIRERFGLLAKGDDRVADWLGAAGAIPAALVVLGLVAYLIVSLTGGA